MKTGQLHSIYLSLPTLLSDGDDKDHRVQCPGSVHHEDGKRVLSVFPVSLLRDEKIKPRGRKRPWAKCFLPCLESKSHRREIVFFLVAAAGLGTEGTLKTWPLLLAENS